MQASEGRFGGEQSQKHWLEVITHQEIFLSVNVEGIKIHEWLGVARRSTNIQKAQACTNH